MPRAHRNVPEPQAVHQLANAALVQGHVEFVHNPLAQIDQTPAYHPIPLRVRASADPRGDLRLLRSRQLPRPTTAVRAVEQTGNPLSVIAMRPIPQRLTVHGRLTRRNPATMSLQNQRNRQHPTPRRRILRAAGLPRRSSGVNSSRVIRTVIAVSSTNDDGESHRFEPLILTFESGQGAAGVDSKNRAADMRSATEFRKEMADMSCRVIATAANRQRGSGPVSGLTARYRNRIGRCLRLGERHAGENGLGTGRGADRMPGTLQIEAMPADRRASDHSQNPIGIVNTENQDQL